VTINPFIIESLARQRRQELYEVMLDASGRRRRGYFAHYGVWPFGSLPRRTSSVAHSVQKKLPRRWRPPAKAPVGHVM
jgi:hypothetical protein